jgi:hypothetical protein
VDDVLVGGIEGQAADREAVRCGMDREDVLIMSGAAEIDRAVAALDLGEMPHLAVERSGALRPAHVDVDAADAAHRGLHVILLHAGDGRQNSPAWRTTAGCCPGNRLHLATPFLLYLWEQLLIDASRTVANQRVSLVAGFRFIIRHAGQTGFDKALRARRHKDPHHSTAARRSI